MGHPTIHHMVDDKGDLWRVQYNGMVREHRQSWQAALFYEAVCAAYCQDQGRGELNNPNDGVHHWRGGQCG